MNRVLLTVDSDPSLRVMLCPITHWRSQLHFNSIWIGHQNMPFHHLLFFTGADRLVVHSLSCVEEKHFQSLSVTAHKWMRMVEVKRWELEKYLTGLKADGFTLIGTEQTDQSRCLSTYKYAAPNIAPRIQRYSNWTVFAYLCCALDELHTMPINKPTLYINLTCESQNLCFAQITQHIQLSDVKTVPNALYHQGFRYRL